MLWLKSRVREEHLITQGGGGMKAGASSKGLSPGRCSIGEQDGSSHHQTSADRRMTSRKWSQEENRVVMQRYYKCEYGRNGYRKRMHAIWNEIGMFNVTDQTFLKGIMGCYNTN